MRYITDQIRKHLLESRESEVCGLVYEDCYVPLRNIAVSPTRFQADPADLARVLARNGEPTAIFHSHLNGAPLPSESDRHNWYFPRSEMWIGTLNGEELLLRRYREPACLLRSNY